MVGLLIWFVNIVIQLFTILVIVHVVLSYFMSPYHPVRQFVDRLVNPLLEPIRRIIPPIGMIDISPIVLLIIVQIVGSIIVNYLLRPLA